MKVFRQLMAHTRLAGWPVVGRTQHASDLLREVQRLKQLNAELCAQEAARAELLVAAIHDLRQPMQAVLLFSEALADEVCSPSQQRAAARMQHAVESMERLSSAMLDLTRMASDELEVSHGQLELAPLLHDVDRTFDPLARQRGLRLIVRPTELRARGDAGLLTRVLNNLVSNALHNTQKGGVLVGVRRESEGVRIDVCDTGEGLIREMQMQNLEAEKAQTMGVGAVESSDALAAMGLATVRHMAGLLGARIGLRSGQGRGTTVSIHLAAA